MSIKGAIGRRLFAKALPVAPLAVRRAGLGILGSVAEKQRAMPSCGAVTASASNPIEDAAYAIKSRKLNAARKFLYEEDNYRNYVHKLERMQAFTQIDPNIIALRSVSDQHKIRMHIAREDWLRDERRTWQEKVLAMFGLEEDKGAKYDLF